MKKINLVFCLLVLLVLAGCSGKIILSAEPKTIVISDFSFNPAEITIKTGETVTWINKDNVPHTIKFDSGRDIESGTLEKEQSYPLVFDKAGTYSYHCSIHPSMKGKMIVK